MHHCFGLAAGDGKSCSWLRPNGGGHRGGYQQWRGRTEKTAQAACKADRVLDPVTGALRQPASAAHQTTCQAVKHSHMSATGSSAGLPPRLCSLSLRPASYASDPNTFA